MFFILVAIFVANSFSAYHNLHQILDEMDQDHQKQQPMNTQTYRENMQTALYTFAWASFGNGLLLIAGYLLLQRNLEKTHQIKQTEQKYQKLLQANVIGILIADWDGRIIEANSTFLQMLGYTQDDLNKKVLRWDKLTPPEYETKDKLAIARLKKNGTMPTWEKEYIHKDGHHVPVLIGGESLDKNRYEVIAFVVDISRQKKAEKEKAKLDATIVDILESVTDSFFAVDKQWRFTYLNSTAEEFAGYKRQELIGKNMWQVFPQMKGSIYQEQYQLAMETGKSVTFQHYLESMRRWFEMHVYPSPQGLSVYYSDITEAKELEQRKDEFISIASHELKTPLTTINSYTQILQRHFQKNNDQESLNYLEKMDAYLHRLMGLIGDLLDVSKIQAGKITLNTESFAFDELLQELVADIQPTTKTHRLVLQGATKVKMMGG